MPPVEDPASEKPLEQRSALGAARGAVRQVGTTSGKRRSPIASSLHAVFALILVITVVTAAYGAAAPSLGIAEFAPSAQSDLEAPPTTGSDQPDGRGGGSGGRRTTTTAKFAGPTLPDGSPDTSGTPTSVVGRGRPCYGNPPRQTEDPMSPPCIATIFEGDNGGATWNGVSETEIRISVPMTAGEGFFTNHMSVIFEHLNSAFEFYGRRLVAVPTGGHYGTPAEKRAKAASAAAQGIFGAVEHFWDHHPAYNAELARQKVVSISIGYDSMLDDKFTYDALHPYVWGVYPSVEQMWANMNSFVCTSLVGRKAQHALDPNLQGNERKFGILAQATNRIPYINPLIEGLAKCGIEAQVWKVDLKDWSAASQARRNAWQQMKANGITSVICACADRSAPGIPTEAFDQGFKPEWIEPLIFFSAGEEEQVAQWWNRDMKLGSSIFGLTSHPKTLPIQSQPWFYLDRELKMRAESTGGWADEQVLEPFYREMMVMASGIQLAGPNLTPETFAAGMMSAQWPNAGAGAAPYWQPSVGFGPGDHTWFNDFALEWYDTRPEAKAYNYNGWSADPTGSWCYIGGGQRFKPGQYPADADDRFFSASEPCR